MCGLIDEGARQESDPGTISIHVRNYVAKNHGSYNVGLFQSICRYKTEREICLKMDISQAFVHMAAHKSVKYCVNFVAILAKHTHTPTHHPLLLQHENANKCIWEHMYNFRHACTQKPHNMSPRQPMSPWQPLTTITQCCHYVHVQRNPDVIRPRKSVLISEVSVWKVQKHDAGGVHFIEVSSLL